MFHTRPTLVRQSQQPQQRPACAASAAAAMASATAAAAEARQRLAIAHSRVCSQALLAWRMQHVPAQRYERMLTACPMRGLAGIASDSCMRLMRLQRRGAALHAGLAASCASRCHAIINEFLTPLFLASPRQQHQYGLPRTPVRCMRLVKTSSLHGGSLQMQPCRWILHAPGRIASPFGAATRASCQHMLTGSYRPCDDNNVFCASGWAGIVAWQACQSCALVGVALVCRDS